MSKSKTSRYVVGSRNSSQPFHITRQVLAKMQALDVEEVFKKYGEEGVNALKESTPKDSGDTANSWSYEILKKNGKPSGLVWHNSNINQGYNVAVLIRYGHGTRTGGYVQGIDYINPALGPVFENICNEIAKEVGDI